MRRARCRSAWRPSSASGLSLNFGIIMSSAVVATVPAIFFFLLLQRYFVRGISTTGLRG